MIPWRTILDPNHGLHEYKAHAAGIDFSTRWTSARRVQNVSCTIIKLGFSDGEGGASAGAG